MEVEVKTILSVMGTLVLTIIVFVAAYWVSKTVGRSYQSTSKSTKPNGIKMIDRHVMGKEQGLYLVQVGGRVFLIGATAQSIVKLDELDATLFPSESLASEQVAPFTDIWRRTMKKHVSEQEKGGASDDS